MKYKLENTTENVAMYRNAYISLDQLAHLKLTDDGHRATVS